MGWLLALILLILTALLFFYRVRGKAPGPKTESTGFDVYVINLDRARQRMADFMEMFRRTDMSELAPIRVAAVDGRNLDLNEIVTPEAFKEIRKAEQVGYRERHYELTRGAVGCALSHRSAWDRLLKSDKDQALICEDDAVLEEDILTQLNQVDPPEDWDILLLGYWCVKCRSYESHRDMQRFFGLHCYIVKRTAVGKISTYTGGRVAQQEDSMLSDMCEEGRLKIYGVPSKLARQSGSGSSVQIPLKTPSEDTDPWLSLPVVLALNKLKV